MGIEAMPTMHNKVLAERLRDPKFRREYEAVRPTYALIGALARLRADAGLTQGELAERIGTKQAYIGRIEAKPANLTLKTLARIAGALGADLEVSFIPAGEEPPLKVCIPARELFAEGLLNRFE